jgi:hypothetical protein
MNVWAFNMWSRQFAEYRRTAVRQCTVSCVDLLRDSGYANDPSSIGQTDWQLFPGQIPTPSELG